MCDFIALAFQTDKTRMASLLSPRSVVALLSVPQRQRRPPRRLAQRHSKNYERITRFHLSQLAYWRKSSKPCPKATAPCSTNSCLMFISNMWSGTRHDNGRCRSSPSAASAARCKRVASSITGSRRRQPKIVQPLPGGSWTGWACGSTGSATPIRDWRDCNSAARAWDGKPPPYSRYIQL